jgi:hypothetical protein
MKVWGRGDPWCGEVRRGVCGEEGATSNEQGARKDVCGPRSPRSGLLVQATSAVRGTRGKQASKVIARKTWRKVLTISERNEGKWACLRVRMSMCESSRKGRVVADPKISRLGSGGDLLYTLQEGFSSWPQPCGAPGFRVDDV